MKKFNDDEILDFVDFVKERKVDLRFIEFMPFTENDWKSKKFVPYADMLD